MFKHVLFLVLILLWLIGLGDTITYDGFGGLLFFYSGILLNINDIDIYRKIKVLANRIHLYIAAYMICLLYTSTIEEHQKSCGMGSALIEILNDLYAEGQIKHYPKVKRIAIPDEFADIVGTQIYLREHEGLKII